MTGFSVIGIIGWIFGWVLLAVAAVTMAWQASVSAGGTGGAAAWSGAFCRSTGTSGGGGGLCGGWFCARGDEAATNRVNKWSMGNLRPAL